MALGRRQPETGSLFITTADLPRSAGHPFYRALNRLLEEAGFDRTVEKLCASSYADGKGRPSIPPGVYFRMIFVGYFEGIDSQRGIAWRCSDSLALREFLGVGLTGPSPDHSSLTVIRQRLSWEIHVAVFTLVLTIAREKKLLGGKTIGVDATMLEANAAMKSIVRRDTGENWKEYLRRLAQEAGIENPSDEELRRFDKKRGGKKTSNDDWKSKTDPDSRVTRMKDGRVHLSYKAEHAVDLDSSLIVAATIHPANRSDTRSLATTTSEAKAMLFAIGNDIAIKELVADKGYHSIEALTTCVANDLRTYIPPRKLCGDRNWLDKSDEERHAVEGNDRRVKGKRGRALQRLRSEVVERTFAHLCRTGGARRTWLRGFENVEKRYLTTVIAHNLGRICRELFGVGKPKGLQDGLAALAAALLLWIATLGRTVATATRLIPRALVRLELRIFPYKTPAAA